MKIETLDKAGYRKFGLIMATVIASLFGLLFPWVFNLKMIIWPWALSSLLCCWALLIPNTLVFIYKPWMMLGHYVGIFNTNIILAD